MTTNDKLRQALETIAKLHIIGPMTSEQGRQLMLVTDIAEKALAASEQESQSMRIFYRNGDPETGDQGDIDFELMEQQKNHWQNQWSDVCNENQHLLNIIAKKDAALTTCKKDAERYRWLRDRIDPREIEEFYILRGYNVNQIISEKTDAAVDAAIMNTKKACT